MDGGRAIASGCIGRAESMVGWSSVAVQTTRQTEQTSSGVDGEGCDVGCGWWEWWREEGGQVRGGCEVERAQSV